jgi:ribosomal protein S17E
MRRACDSFLKEAQGRCFLCSTVKDEALRLINSSYSMILSDFQKNLKPFLDAQGIKELNNRHGKYLAQFFSQRKRDLKAKFPTSSNLRNEIIGTVENYVASKLHSLQDGVKISSDNFLAALITELNAKKHELEAPFQTLKCFTIIPHESIVSQVVVGALIMNRKDAEHLASSITHQFQHNKWVIFVTNDENHILGREKEIFEVFSLRCSKPEWAQDYYVDMTKKKSPVEDFSEISQYSRGQTDFGDVIERNLGIRILNQTPKTQ